MFAMTNQLDMGGPWEEFLIARHGRDCPSLASNFSGLWFSLSLSLCSWSWVVGGGYSYSGKIEPKWSVPH